MSEIYVPIDSSNTKDVIPPGETIFCSIMASYTAETGGGRYRMSTSFSTHVLMTDKGIALIIPTRKETSEPKYMPWYEVYGAAAHMMFLHNMNEKLLLGGSMFPERVPNKTPIDHLFAKILPLLITEKENILQSYDLANIKPKVIKRITKSLKTNKKLYNALQKRIQKKGSI